VIANWPVIALIARKNDSDRRYWKTRDTLLAYKRLVFKI